MAAFALVCAATTWSGCAPETKPKGLHHGPQSSSDSSGDLIKSLASNINHLEEFDFPQMLSQVRGRLNQWVLKDSPTTAWERDPLVASLPEGLQKLKEVQALDSLDYTADDVVFLQEAIWMRDIAKTRQDAQFDDLKQAQRLFDWTIRNLQLQAEPTGSAVRVPHAPRDILLLARGTAEERAWVFTLLARQLGIDVVILAVPTGEDKAPRAWVPAVLYQKELYLFDSRLGLPIPGPAGQGIATLSQVADDDSLLRALDVDEKHPYPMEASRLKDVVPWIEGSPGYLSKRMKLVESRLTGSNNVVLTASPASLAERLSSIPHLARRSCGLLVTSSWNGALT